jgi:hypothetical protein
MLEKQTALMRTSGAFLMLIFMTSCTADDCVWAKKIIVSEQDVVTRPTAEQIVVHNRKVERFCR